jgi:hypothetical protein
MSLNMYALERLASDIDAQRLRDAKSYRLWQKVRKSAPKRTK